MHQPRPYGLHSTLQSDDDDAAAVEALARRLTNIKSASALDSMKMVRALPSGGVAIAVDMGGVFRVIVQKPDDELPEPSTFDGVASSKLPMLFSGVIVQPVVLPPQGVQMRLTAQCAKRLGGYGDEKKKPPGANQTLQRFAIEYNGIHAELRPWRPGSLLHTQYSRLHPSWFSGAMAKLVQVAGGYGRQDLGALPKSAVERAEMTVPAKVMARIEDQLGNIRLPGYTGAPPKSGQIQYDYKFHNTNAVSFDSKGKPWLLRIRSDGVHAMPLPMVPATTTQAFRDYIEQVNDPEILWLLDEFGGMPSGEPFPASSSFEAWKRAGVIIKVCDAGDFYSQLAYATSCGWSFNSRGTEGYNTCYNYDDSDGIQLGFAYKLSLSMASADNDGKLPKALDVADPADARALDAYLSSIYRELGSEVKDLAIKYKLRRASVGELLARAKGCPSGAAEVLYWDSLQMAPIASHTGSIRRTGQGNLWAPGKPKFHPQIKFPEPSMEGCVSHDFSPAEYISAPPGWVVPCDTIMFGYYVGDDLKVIKYFYDIHKYVRQVEDNYDDCMVVGSWERTSTQGETTVMGHFYTSDIDEREDAAPITTVTKTVGTDLGYDTKPKFEFDHFFAMVGTLSRSRYFQHKVTTTKTEGYSRTLAVCIPFFERNSVLHAKRESTSGATKTESLGVYAIGDPNSYRFSTYDFIWAWVGGSHKGNMATVDPIQPVKDGNPVSVCGYNYFPYPCSDFADQGDWVGSLPADYTWLIHPSRHEWQHSGSGGPPTVKGYSNSKTEKGKNEGELVISLLPSVQKVNKDPSNGYFLPSPNEFGDVFYVDAIQLAAGEAVYASCSEADPESPKQRKRWGFTTLADHKRAHNFIGVINE